MSKIENFAEMRNWFCFKDGSKDGCTNIDKNIDCEECIWNYQQQEIDRLRKKLEDQQCNKQ